MRIRALPEEAGRGEDLDTLIEKFSRRPAKGEVGMGMKFVSLKPSVRTDTDTYLFTGGTERREYKHVDAVHAVAGRTLEDCAQVFQGAGILFRDAQEPRVRGLLRSQSCEDTFGRSGPTSESAVHSFIGDLEESLSSEFFDRGQDLRVEVFTPEELQHHIQRHPSLLDLWRETCQGLIRVYGNQLRSVLLLQHQLANRSML